MSTNLATLMVGLGYDLSALERGAPEAFRIVNSQTLGMSAEMKRSSREGAESLRLISENLGLHVSRPLSRILTQEFPAFAAGLQTVLGGAVFGAVADIGFRAFEKVTKGIENAEKAQEAWGDAARKTEDVYSDVINGIERKLASIKGQPAAIKFAIEGAEEARKGIDSVAKALENEQAAAEKAQSLTTKIYAGVGNFFSQLGRAAAAAIPDTAVGGHNFLEQYFTRADQLEQLKQTLKTMKDQLDDVMRADTKSGAHDALSLINTDLGRIETNLRLMQKAGNEAGVALAEDAKRFLEDSKKIEEGTINLAHHQTGQADAEASKKAIHDLQEELKGWNEENNKAVEAWIKLNNELDKAVAKLDDNIFKDTAQRTKEFALPHQVAPPSGAPMLKDQEELAKISGQWTGISGLDQQTEAWKKAGQVLEEIETPAQKYATALQILHTLHDQGRISAEQMALAEQKLGEQLTSAELRVLAMQKALEKLLAHSTSAADGVRAFFLQLEINAAQNGKFAFDLLNSGLKGFEDQLTATVFQGKAKWGDLFRSMGEEVFKFTLTKGFAQIFQMFSQSGAGKGLGLDKLVPNLGDKAGGAALTTAAATLQTGSTTLLTLATTLQAAASTLSVSGAGGAGGGAGAIAGLIPGFASGTTDAPGGLSWVGEQGPELLNIPAGSSVTPTSAAKRMGGDIHYYDQRGAVVTDDLMRKGDASRMMNAAKQAWLGEAVANVNEIRKRTAGPQ